MNKPTNAIIEKRKEEKRIVKAIAKYLADSGYVVFTNVILLDTEIDIVAIKECRNKHIVKIVEVKSLPKIKLVKQVHARACIAHYVYAGLPAQYRDWAFRKLPEWCGIMLVKNDDKVVIARRAQKLNHENDAPTHFARLLLSCGNFMSSKVYAPQGQGDGLKVLARLRSFLSSSDSSSFTDSSSGNSPDFDSLGRVILKSYIIAL